jgi:putative chromate ion transporter
MPTIAVHLATGRRFKTKGPCVSAYSLKQLVLFSLKLGTVGFGGPVALIGYMHRDLVERRKWISESDYKDGLALAQLAPGPLAAQLAIYLGYVDYGILGATLVGTAFVLPSFLMVLGIGWAYVAYGGLSWMQSVFYAVGASVIGIIAVSAFRLTTRTVGKDPLLLTIYLAVMALTVVTESEIIAVFVASGVIAWLVKAPPKWLETAKSPFLRPSTFTRSLRQSFSEFAVVADLLVLCQSWRVCLRQRPGDCAVLVRWSCEGVPVVK